MKARKPTVIEFATAACYLESQGRPENDQLHDNVKTDLRTVAAWLRKKQKRQLRKQGGKVYAPKAGA